MEKRLAHKGPVRRSGTSAEGEAANAIPPSGNSAEDRTRALVDADVVHRGARFVVSFLFLFINIMYIHS
jgi:hypothetical protein